MIRILRSNIVQSTSGIFAKCIHYFLKVAYTVYERRLNTVSKTENKCIICVCLASMISNITSTGDGFFYYMNCAVQTRKRISEKPTVAFTDSTVFILDY